MPETKFTRPLTIMEAQEGGFVVYENQYSGGAHSIEFAGPIDACLGYIHRSLTDVRAGFAAASETFSRGEAITVRERLLQRLESTSLNPISVVLYRSEIDTIALALDRLVATPSSLTLADVKWDTGELKPGPVTHVPPTDLHDVLDAYRRAGAMCGVQVFAADHVVSWIGDLEKAIGSSLVRLRTYESPAIILHTERGVDALEATAKWLRSELDDQIRRRGGQAEKVGHD